MREPNETLRSFLARGDFPAGVTIPGGDELRAFDEKVSAESGEPLENGAAVVKLERGDRTIAAFTFMFFILCLGGLVWYVLRDGTEVYVYNPSWIATPGIMLVFISGIALYVILHVGFSDIWFILEKDRVRFRVRRAFRYRVESFPFASIEEIAIEVFPASPRHGELARLAVVRDARQVELFRGQVEDEKGGDITFSAGLLGAATGLPVTRRQFRRFWKNP